MSNKITVNISDIPRLIRCASHFLYGKNYAGQQLVKKSREAVRGTELHGQAEEYINRVIIDKAKVSKQVMLVL